MVRKSVQDECADGIINDDRDMMFTSSDTGNADGILLYWLLLCSAASALRSCVLYAHVSG